MGINRQLAQKPQMEFVRKTIKKNVYYKTTAPHELNQSDITPSPVSSNSVDYLKYYCH